MGWETPEAGGKHRTRPPAAGRRPPPPRTGGAAAASLLPPPAPRLPSRGRENSDTWRLGEVDAMAEIRGGSLGRSEGTGPTAATLSRARCSPQCAQAGDSPTPSSGLPSGTCSKTTQSPNSGQTLLTKLPQSRAPPGSRPASGPQPFRLRHQHAHCLVLSHPALASARGIARPGEDSLPPAELGRKSGWARRSAGQLRLGVRAGTILFSSLPGSFTL